MTPEDLVEIELIKRLKYRYLRYLDQKLFDEMRDVFTVDATARYSGGHYSFDGVDAIIDFLKESMSSEEFLSSHRCHHPEIDLIGSERATGIWALEDTVIDTQFEITLRGAAFYRDEYLKIDGKWKIHSTGYERTFEEMESRKENPSLTLTQRKWGAE